MNGFLRILGLTGRKGSDEQPSGDRVDARSDDANGPVAVVFAALSPHNLNPTPGFAAHRLEQIIQRARDELDAPRLAVRVFDPTEWKSKPWQRTPHVVEDLKTPAVRYAARKLKELGLPKQAIKDFRTSETTILFHGPGPRVYIAGLIDNVSIDLGPLHKPVSSTEPAPEQTAIRDAPPREQAIQKDATDGETAILAYWTQNPGLPSFSVRCRFDSVLEARYADRLRNRFGAENAPVVWVYPDEWPGALAFREDTTEADLHLQRTVLASVAWRDAADDRLGGTVSTLVFETTEIDEIKLVLFAAPLQAHSRIINHLLAARPATEERLADDLEKIKAMGSLVHSNGEGRPALFVFEVSDLEDGYRQQIESDVEAVLAGSQGMNVILRGQLDEGPGGGEAVVHDLREVRDGGWIFITHRPDGPLRTFGMEGTFGAYAVLLWTDRDENIERLHAQWRETIPHAYLGYLCSPHAVTLPWLSDAFSEMNLVPGGMLRNGHYSQEEYLLRTHVPGDDLLDQEPTDAAIQESTPRDSEGSDTAKQQDFRLLLSAFNDAPASLRAAVMKAWFRRSGITWFEDFPHRAENTFCESCSANLSGKEVFRNGDEVRCESCIDRNLGWWEEDGADRDYFGFGVVDKAIEFAADDIADWGKSNSMAE